MPGAGSAESGQSLPGKAGHQGRTG